MELYEAIEKRRTIRAYEKPASQEQVRRIMLAGTKAPSARNSQPWELILVEDGETRERIAQLKYQLTLRRIEDAPGDKEKIEEAARGQRDSFRNAGVVVVCNRREWERSVWLCIENMSLAAVAEGLGSGIVLFWGEEKVALHGLLGLPDNYEVTAALKLGVPAEEGFPREENPYAPRRPDFSWLHKDRFGRRSE